MACKCSPEQRDDTVKKYVETSNIPIFDIHPYTPCDSSVDVSVYPHSVVFELLKRMELLEERVTKLEKNHK